MIFQFADLFIERLDSGREESVYAEGLPLLECEPHSLEEPRVPDVVDPRDGGRAHARLVRALARRHADRAGA